MTQEYNSELVKIIRELVPDSLGLLFVPDSELSKLKTKASE